MPVWMPCQISSGVLPDPSRAEAIQSLTRGSNGLRQISVFVGPLREQDQVTVRDGHGNDRRGLRVAVGHNGKQTLDLRLYAFRKGIQSDPHSATADSAPALLT